MNKRDAILSGTAAASELHDKLDVRETIESGVRGNVDVFGAIINQHAKLVFRPLEGLLGACLAGPGVIISTGRPLPIQRFTGSHELCHVIMNHHLSLDGEEILAGELSTGAEGIEIQANAFAAEFLLPPWLFGYHAKRQGWVRESMENPQNVYQMSLRVGASYNATVRALKTHNFIDDANFQKLIKIVPKDQKEKLLPGYTPENWRRDVWLITAKDRGAFIEGHPDDLFKFCLNEKTGAGYIWDFETLKRSGFVILNDEREKRSKNDEIGSDVLRKLTAQSSGRPKGELHLHLRRPWDKSGSPADELQFKYDLMGKERGLPRAQRPQVAEAA